MAESDGLRRLRDMREVDATSLDVVYRTLADPDPTIRRDAVKLIARSPASPALISMLERALTDDLELARRSSAMDALAAMGKPALPLLSRLAGDTRVGVRRLAIDALGLSRLPDALDVLERSTRDPQPAVRSAALEAVARTGAGKAAAILVRVAEDKTEQPAVVLAALLGLLQLDRAPSVETLKRHVADALTAPPALRLLGRTGEAEFLADALVTSMGSRQRAAVLGLAEALETAPLPARLKNKDAWPLLRKLVQNAEIQVACAALMCAAHAGDVDVLLQAAARDDRAYLSSAAHRAVSVLRAHGFELTESLRVMLADDAPGADLLHELADAASARRVVSSGPPKLDDRAFSRLSRLLESAAGLAIAEDARVRLEARLLPRVEASGVGDFSAYVDLLGAPRGASELLRALDLVTVHETYFFRERGQLEAFRDDFMRTIPAPKPVRIWSAGTSTGEEAYTLAILLEEAGFHSRYEVLGTDLSVESIEWARAGRYLPRSFRGEIEAAVRKRWFIYELGGVQIQPMLKRSVRFEVMNLLDEATERTLPQFDAIFCRNVLIYMSTPARARLIDLFWRKLRPGGVLLLGHSESLLNVDTPFKLRPLRRGLGYEKGQEDG